MKLLDVRGLVRGEVQVGPFQARAEIVVDSIRDNADGTLSVPMRLASKFPVRRFGYFDGRFEEFEEVLSFEEGAHRDARLNSGRCPLLAVHDTYSLESTLGVLENPAWDRTNGALDVTARVSARAELQGLRQDIKARIVTNTSVGYRVYQYRDVTQKGDQRRRLLAIDWETCEGSLVPVGADPDTATRAEASRGAEAAAVWTAPEHGIPTMDQNTAEASRTTPSAPTPTTAGAPPSPQPAAAAAPSGPSPERAAEEARTSELERGRAIRGKLTRAGLPLDGEFARSLLDQPVTFAQATERILDAVTQRDAGPSSTSSQVPATIADDDGDKAVRAITDALEHRTIRELLTPQERTELDGRLKGNPYVHRSLLQIGEDYLRRVHGKRGLETLSKRELAGEVLFTRRGDSIRAPGFHVTSDFASLLANIFNKGLQRQYDLTPDTYSQWVEFGTLADFKQGSRVNVGDAPRLLRRYEGAEYSKGAVGERGEPVQLVSYGRMLTLSREAMINDDLGAFARYPRAFGDSSKQLVADLVYLTLTANATMADGFALFDATNHGNYITAASNAFTSANAIQALSNTRALARRQKGIAPGNTETPFFLSVNLAHLRVPENLETIAQQLTTAIQAQQLGNVNPFQGAFRSVMAEPRLGAVSQAAFYLMSDPAAMPGVEVDFLQGEQGPVIESRMSWNSEGVEMKCRLDVGVAATEYRGLYKNDGAT